MEHSAFGVIDLQRGFTPAEGEYTRRKGFGELPVPDGHAIIDPVNALLQALTSTNSPDLTMRPAYTFTTQDWHPKHTAHFSEQPDYTNDWPRHCVAGTPGAKLHPKLYLPHGTEQFVKGTTPLKRGEDDTSYSAYYAHNLRTGKTLPDRLRERNINHVYLGGLALDYCVGKTALDIRTKLGINVSVVTEATRGIAKDSQKAMLAEFKKHKIKTISVYELLGKTVLTYKLVRPYTR